MLPSRKRSPDGASRDWRGGHLIAAYYSFIYPERMKDWVGLVGVPIAVGLPTYMDTRQLQVERRTATFRRSKIDVLPLCHATSIERKSTMQCSKLTQTVCVTTWRHKITRLQCNATKQVKIGSPNRSHGQIWPATLVGLKIAIAKRRKLNYCVWSCEHYAEWTTSESSVW